jgi:hypothetical protein
LGGDSTIEACIWCGSDPCPRTPHWISAQGMCQLVRRRNRPGSTRNTDMGTASR